MKQLNDDDNTKKRERDRSVVGGRGVKSAQRLIVQFDAIAGFKGHTRCP